MKILFINAYFIPETIAFSHLEKDIIEGLIATGNEIEVICPIPTRGVSDEVYKKYKYIHTEKLYNGKVQVKRFWAPREGGGVLTRAFRYLWCNIREYQIGKKYKNIDAVFAVSTPPTQGLLAGRLSKKLQCPFIYSVQDIFPDSLVTTGITRQESLIWKIGRKIEKKTYEYAKHIIVISKTCKKNLLKKGVSESKLSLVSNWVDIEKIKPIAREKNRLITELQINPKKFLVVYAGNFGAAQGADIVLKAAELLCAEDGIQFVIFGGGAEFNDAVDYVKNHKLSNVLIQPLLPQKRVAEVYSLGNVALITCKSGVGKSGMPSKTWSIMACDTPIIACFDEESDLKELLRSSGAGICIPPENAEKLSNAIVEIKKKGIRYAGGRKYVIENAAKACCVKKYLNIICGKTQKKCDNGITFG